MTYVRRVNISPGFATATTGGFGPQTERSTVSFCDKCSSDDRATCTGYRQFPTIALACSCQCHNAAIVARESDESDDLRIMRDAIDRTIAHLYEEKERRLKAEREEVLTRRVAEFAWSITSSWGDRRSRETAQGILATMRLEKHNSLARVVAAARALAAGDISAAAELRLAVAALDADPQVDLPSPASGAASSPGVVATHAGGIRGSTTGGQNR